MLHWPFGSNFDSTRRDFTQAVALGGLLAASGTVFAQAGPVAAGTSDRMPVKIAWIPGSVYRLSLCVARDLFTKHGLNAELIRFSSGPAMNAAFKSASVDMGFSGAPGVLTILSTGAPLKVFMIDNNTATSNALVAVPGSGINTVADLKGKSIAIPRGTVVWVALIKALRQNGLDLKDVNVVDMGAGPLIAAFRNKDVQAAWIWSPVLYELLDMGGKEIVRDAKFGIAPNFWVGRSEWVEKNPQAVQRFLAAMDEAGAFHKADPKESARLVAEQLGIKLTNAERLLQETTYFSMADQVAPVGPASLVNKSTGALEALRSYAAILNEQGLLRAVPDLNSIIDSSHVEAYLKTQHKG